MKREIDLPVCLRLINNGPLVLVGTRGTERFNAAPVAWAVPAAKTPPTVALFVNPGHCTWQNLEQAGCFTLNVPGRDLLQQVAFLGGSSGKERDKLAECGLQAVRAKTSPAPIFPACLGHLECRLLSLDRDRHLVMGQVEYALADEELFFDHWRLEQGRYPLQHLGGQWYQCGGETMTQERLASWPPPAID